MRQRLVELLRCPSCGLRLHAGAFETASDGSVQQGVLNCSCGAVFPVIDSIPRMLLNAAEMFPNFYAAYGLAIAARTRHGPRRNRAAHLMARTQHSFGYQWTTFSEMSCDFQENFWTYLHPATPEFFRGRLGLDAGCGFGRHIYHAARCGAEMVGVDFSRAIESTRRNTQQLADVHLVQADIYRLPFAPGTFDFAYSVGVLHHLPDPGRGVAALAQVLKPEGMLFIWLYSSTRRFLNALLESVRMISTRLPHPIIRALSWVGALIDWTVIGTYRIARRVPVFGPLCECLAPARVKLYNRYPFQVAYADWFDRLAAPIRFYYDEEGTRRLVAAVGLTNIRVEPTGLYGWRACGVKQGHANTAAKGDGQAQTQCYAT